MSEQPSLDHDAPCPGCERAIGDHTFREYEACLKSVGFDYVLPFEDVPDGPLNFPHETAAKCTEAEEQLEEFLALLATEDA